MNIEMNMEMSVTLLLLKTLENATLAYARECVTKCGSIYGFDSNEALAALKLEKLNIQVREMKKRGAAEKKEKAVKEKVVKEKPKKVAKREGRKSSSAKAVNSVTICKINGFRRMLPGISLQRWTVYSMPKDAYGSKFLL